jgi:hypothetical protein
MKPENKTAAKKLLKKLDIKNFVKGPDKNDGARIAPKDLFSLFTANIIKRKVTFTR